jgi:hypothetical protein
MQVNPDDNERAAVAPPGAGGECEMAPGAQGAYTAAGTAAAGHAAPAATPGPAVADATVADLRVMCAKHDVALVPGTVELSYQGHTFPVDVLCCPVCGEVLIPEEVARGKMHEVEQTLEEK